jgi:hypothetical protein
MTTPTPQALNNLPGDKRTPLRVLKALLGHPKKRVAAAIMLVTSVAGCSYGSRSEGHFAAKYDVDHGRYELQTFGLPPPWFQDDAALLQQRYAVNVRPVAGCMVSESQVSYVEAYNDVMAAAANRKYGHDIFVECRADARKAYAQRQSSQPAANLPVAASRP